MEFSARVTWQRAGQPFLDQRYSRVHAWSFDGGASVPASSSPLSVPVPMSDPAAVDPEEAVVAAASSCHMLFFLSIAAKRGHVIDSYEDQAAGRLDKDADGRAALVRIALRPRIAFAGQQPDAEEIAHIHHLAHEQCYVANSLRCPVVVEES
ncbi:OsmC family protein [Massilia sp. ST3]|uniref:OsmC family protein n=1 Tax=Massilia sp. ST3 TaxID=2824903 RepID=UPI001B80FC27|nr:OsmC family protein [Massilia sp. ST3]MBQ5949144.1 OsmC family protein [Massilia sp. ST3]